MVRIDPPLRMAGMLCALMATVLAPCLVTFATGEKHWLMAWPLAIWAALYLIQITEPAAEDVLPVKPIPRIGGEEAFASVSRRRRSGTGND